MILPKEKLAELDQFLNELLSFHEKGIPSWKHLFDRLGDFFDERFGREWKKEQGDSWEEFSRIYLVGDGIKSRLMRDQKIRSKGI